MKSNILLTLCVFLLSAGSAVGQVSFGEADKFDEGWHFILDDVKNGESQDLDCTAWRTLDLPHDWSIEADMSADLASCTGYLPAGIAWYRKDFRVDDPSKRYYIYFEGVYNRSEVYLNGHLLGSRPNGYISFMYDMTPFIKTDGDNVLAVRVDHSRSADSRWYTGSGIYRDVWLVKSGQTHLSQWSIAYRLSKMQASGKALVEIDFAVESSIDDKSRLTVVNEILDAEGKCVASDEQPLKQLGKYTVVVTVPDAHRWNLEDPYLYSLHTVLYSNGKKIDEALTPMGLRTLEFGADKGFALNGKRMKVKGVCIHHDAGVLGTAVPEDVWRRRLLELKGIGVNALRMSHNPQAPAIYKLCDELGLLVMDEASDEWEFPKRKWLTGWNDGTPGYEGSYDFFNEWGERDLTDMVRRDRNHPSVFMWSIGNEVDYPNDPYSHPILDGGEGSGFTQAQYGGYRPDAPNAMRIGVIAQRMAAATRAVDTSRPVTGALAGVVMSNQTAYPSAVDVVGYNYTESRYAEDHKTYPDRILYGSENRADYKAWTYVRDNDYIFGQFIWTGLDYLGESRKWPSRGFGSGLLDFAGLRKPEAWFRASLWSEEPMAYIGTYRRKGNTVSTDAQDTWNYKDGETIRVVCYTNCGRARLLLDGKTVGEEKPYNMDNGVIWWDIPFHAGELRVEGLGDDGSFKAEYSIHTSGEPVALRASIDKSALQGTGRVAHIIVEVIDRDGHPVKSSDALVSCSVKGPASLIGLENASNTDTSNAKATERLTHNGKLLAYIESTDAAGTVEVCFSAPSLHGCSVQLTVN